MLSERFPWGVERARRPWLLVVLCLAVAVAVAYLIEGWLPHRAQSGSLV